MAAFLTFNEFAAIYEDVVDEPARAVLALDAACDAVREHMCQTIARVTNEVITVVGSNTRALLLPELPVITVTSVVASGAALIDWSIDPTGAGILWRDDPGYWPRTDKFVVTYTHGYATSADIPAHIRRVTIQLAKLDFDNPGSIQQEGAGPFSVTYAQSGSLLASLPVLKRVPMP